MTSKLQENITGQKKWKFKSPVGKQLVAIKCFVPENLHIFPPFSINIQVNLFSGPQGNSSWSMRRRACGGWLRQPPPTDASETRDHQCQKTLLFKTFCLLKNVFPPIFLPIFVSGNKKQFELKTAHGSECRSYFVNIPSPPIFVCNSPSAKGILSAFGPVHDCFFPASHTFLVTKIPAVCPYFSDE